MLDHDFSNIDDDFRHLDGLPDTDQAERATTAVLARAAKPQRPASLGDAKRRRPHEIDPTVKWDFLGHVLSDDALTPAAKRIAHALLTRYNHSDGYCFPGIETLMEDTGYGRTQTIEGQKSLVSRKWFTAIKARRGNRNLPNRYSPNLARVGLTGKEGERLEGFDSPEKRTVRFRKVEATETITGGFDSPEKRILTVRKSDASQSGKLDPNPVKGTHEKETQVRQTGNPFVNEGSGEPPVSRSCFAGSPPPKASSKRDRSSTQKSWIEPEIINGWWDEFRDAYPHEPGLDSAKGMFCQVILDRKVTIEALLDAVQRYADDLVTTGIASANATKWLCDERWLDEYAFRAPEREAKGASTTKPVPKAAPTPQPVPETTPAPATCRDYRDHPPTGVVITESWRPALTVWAMGVEKAGLQMAEEHLATFRDLKGGRRVNDPDAEWLSWCEPF